MRNRVKGLPRGGGFHLGGFPLLIATVILMVVACMTYVMWPTERNPTGQSASVTNHLDPRQTISRQLCRAEGLRCATTTTAAGEAIEYAIVSGPKKPSRGLVLIELGGPGLDLFAKASIDSFGLPGEMLDYDILLLREPWASQAPSRQCLERLDGLGAMTSEGRAGPIVVDKHGCAFDVWTRATYTAAVAAVVKSERRTLTGIIGQSFGAVLAAQAREVAPEAWLLIHAPIAPPGAPAARVIADRIGALERSMNSSYARNCGPLKLSCTKSGWNVSREASQRLSDTALKDRSKPLGHGDIALATMAAAYDLPANEQWLWRTLSEFPDVSDEDLITLGRLSDQLLQRYDERSISPRLGAYIAGLCGAYQGWERPQQAGSTHAGLLLDIVEVQCTEANLPAGAWSPLELARLRNGASTCILTNRSDTVVAGEWAERWRQLLPQSEIRHYSYAGHGSLARALDLIEDSCGPFPVGPRSFVSR